MRTFKFFAFTLALALVVFLQPTTAANQSRGLSPKQLSDSGWTCFNVPPLGVHCSPPGEERPPTEPVVQLLYFFSTPARSPATPAVTAAETLIRADIFNGQPCPTEPSGEYTFLPDIGIPLDSYVVHRPQSARKST